MCRWTATAWWIRTTCAARSAPTPSWCRSCTPTPRWGPSSRWAPSGGSPASGRFPSTWTRCRPSASCRWTSTPSASTCCSFSVHKIYGPKGIAGLYIRKGTKMASVQHGGEHERRRRAGTENVPGIVGLGKAVEVRARDMAAEESRVRGAPGPPLGGARAAGCRRSGSTAIPPSGCPAPATSASGTSSPNPSCWGWISRASRSRRGRPAPRGTSSRPTCSSPWGCPLDWAMGAVRCSLGRTHHRRGHRLRARLRGAAGGQAAEPLSARRPEVRYSPTADRALPQPAQRGHDAGSRRGRGERVPGVHGPRARVPARARGTGDGGAVPDLRVRADHRGVERGHRADPGASRWRTCWSWSTREWSRRWAGFPRTAPMPPRW